MKHFLGDLTDRAARRARTRFPAGSRVGDRLRAVRRRLPRRPPVRPIGQVIFQFAAERPDATVVQIGAHDGTAIDPLRDEILCRRWRGILVEPVPYVFERLKANYAGNSRVILENAAIADADGTREFFHLPESSGGELWKWYDALGSFRREVVLTHTDLIPDIEERIVTTLVPCLTFDSLFTKHGIQDIHFIQTDTEGYDLELLRLFDIGRRRPSLVMFEHLHLSDAERAEADSLLDAHGYEKIADKMDTLAVQRATLRELPVLRRVWDRVVSEGPGGAR